jgi:site-specific DNA recombinase
MSTALPTGTLEERLRPVKALRVYFRQSTDQNQQRESVPIQRAECQRLAQALGLSDIEWARRHEYVDVDRSGDDFTGRENLTRLLREAQAGDIILAWKQDRVGRDMIDSAAAIRELVKRRRCALYTVETWTMAVTLDSAEQTAMVMFRGMVAQGELERIRSRTRDGLRQRARDGFAFGTVPYGYKTVLVDPNVTERKKSKKRIEIDERLAPIIRRVFTLYLDGYGYARIAKVLNSEGAPSGRGRRWSSSSVWELLRDRRYIGEWTYGQRRVVGREGDKVIFEQAPEDQVIRMKREDLAIIPPDLWAKVQAALASRSREMPAQRAASAASTEHMLSGTLRCAECGGPMGIRNCHGRRASWTRRYYVCAHRKRTGRCSNSVHLPADEVEPKMVAYIQDQVLGQIEDSLRSAIRGEIDAAISMAAVRSEEAERIKSELDALKKVRERLIKIAAVTDAPEVVEELCANQERSKELQERLAIATRPAIDRALAERLEASALAQVQRMREQLTAGEAREALTALFPSGLRFRIGDGLWLIEGAASVPTVRNPDGIRIPDASGADGVDVHGADVLLEDAATRLAFGATATAAPASTAWGKARDGEAGIADVRCPCRRDRRRLPMMSLRMRG